MAILRSLRLAGTALLVLTVLCIFVLPGGIVPMMVGIALAGLTALDLLVVFVLTLVRDHSFRGLVQALVALSLVLMLGGGIGSMAQAGSYYIQLEEGETAMLAGRGMDGYALTLESGVHDNSLDVALTRPDQVTVHETISPTAPMTYDGIEVHPSLGAGSDAVLLVRYDWFRHLIRIGGILFLISLGLSAIPAVRKRRGDAC